VHGGSIQGRGLDDATGCNPQLVGAITEPCLTPLWDNELDLEGALMGGHFAMPDSDAQGK
jgi:hypothetical protein